MPYRDLRHYLDCLEAGGKLHRITKEVDKDWEISAVCRRVFETIPPSERPALMFEKVRGHDMPVVAGVLGGSPAIYGMALETSVEGILDKWQQAERSPIAPVRVATGPCKKNIDRDSKVNLQRLPIPTWTVEHDPGPYITSPYVVTRDRETGVQNTGTYRMQLKGRDKTGLMIGKAQDASRHIQKNELIGRPTPAAVVIGADPTIGLVSVSALPYGMDEFAVAGGLRGEPIELVRCETSDLEVPATAEIILEGELLPDEREHEGPFGEYTGYMGASGNHYVFHVHCVTYRDHPIYQAFISQMPPSESSCIRRIGREQPMLRHLRDTMRLPVRDVHFKESGGSGAFVVISIRKHVLTHVQQTAMAAWSHGPGFAKYLIIVDDDIDIRNPFAVEWAMSFRVRPEQDIYIFKDMQAVGLDPSTAPYKVPQHAPERLKAGKVLIDATKKHDYPPIAKPPADHIERVAAQWQAYGFETREKSK